MSVVKELETPREFPENVIIPPSDLFSDEPPLETYLHLQQMLLLIKCLDWWWRDRQDFFSAGNLTIYYSPHQRRSEDFRGPDFFVVLGVERYPRKSWVVWEEQGKYPNVIIEILSPTTAKSDRGLKKRVYQDIFRTPDYFWFDPETLELAGFMLVGGEYQQLKPNSQEQLWSQQLNLYVGIHNRQLRFFTPEGQLVPTPEEAAELAQQQVQQQIERAECELQQQIERAERELQQQIERAERATERSERLAAKLRELNIDPDSL